MAFVLDASVCAVWALADETYPLADVAMEQLDRENALVPSLWWFEVRNVLVMSERRKRLTAGESGTFLNFLQGFPIWADPERDEEAIFGYARKFQLSFYDAAYLDVAHRNQLPLATLDKALRAAAEAAGIRLLNH
jgi:predicted nucleic acid-binding protein